jgi:hypothetical protein
MNKTLLMFISCIMPLSVDAQNAAQEPGEVLLPKPVTLHMFDNSVIFSRFAAAENGVLVFRYIIDVRKTLFEKAAYPDIRKFYKEMYHLINKQVVLKKA